jgi:signal transduction histidine kinase
MAMNEIPIPVLSDARDRIAKLHAVTAALSESILPSDVAQVVVREMAAVLAADQAAIAALSPDGSDLVLLQRTGSGDLPLAAVFRTGEPLWTTAMACAPLIVKGEKLGVVGFGFAEAQSFDAAARALIEDLARQAALAFERARLYQRLERAGRARDEMVAVVSHDLRNPLGSILLSTASAMNLELTDPKAPRVRKHLATIRRSAERMTQLIDDLVDFDAVTGGQLTVARSRCDAAAVVAAAAGMLASLAEERGVRVATSSDAGVSIDGDRDRLVQAMVHLLSNAITVTEPGGLITAGAEARGGEVLFFVSDSGPGIGAEELPDVFDRYGRRNTSRSHYKGSGLGLTIARGIVEAHGGRIWAESRVGAGSTFYFALPAASAESNG